MIDTELLKYATPRQAEMIEAVNLHGSGGAAALVLGMAKAGINRAIAAVRVKAAKQGYSPDHDMIHTVPAPFSLKGTSTLYGKDGKVINQWVKTKREDETSEESIRDWMDWLGIEAIRGLAIPTPRPAYAAPSLLALYGLGDPHFGMRADGDETGVDFDLPTAERITAQAIDRLVASSPPAETALILNIGDMFHADDQTNRTPGHGNQLDVDGRHFKVMQVGLRSMVHIIRRALEKHAKVIFVITPGNHDPRSSFGLALALSAFFENEPRVDIDVSPAAYKYHRFGKVLIGMTHGDGAKTAELPLLMATDQAAAWGETAYRYWLTGHIHHDTVKEIQGVRCESLRTMAPGDAWHAAQGYRAGRDMRLIVFHENYGEVERHRCDAAMLEQTL